MADDLPTPAPTPRPPYYAVLFTSRRPATEADDGYAATAARMVELASAQPGFLGVESVRGLDGVGITISYWDTLEHLHAWGRHAEHLLAQEAGRSRFYESFALRICKVEADRFFQRGAD